MSGSARRTPGKVALEVDLQTAGWTTFADVLGRPVGAGAIGGSTTQAGGLGWSWFVPLGLVRS